MKTAFVIMKNDTPVAVVVGGEIDAARRAGALASEDFAAARAEDPRMTWEEYSLSRNWRERELPLLTGGG